MNGRHRGAAQRPAVTALWVSRYASGVIVLVAVPLGVIALLAWLIFLATPREQWAGSGLIFLGGAIATFIRGRGRSYSRWSAAGQALVATSLFMNAAAAQRHWPHAFTAVNDSIRAIAAACLVTSITLNLRSGRLRFRRPPWLSRGSSTPG
ncbi:MAG TPA: hypothetical protein VNF47_15655 [Streptosporangiaceae bacterium]|nr:hypothetical protein [Streptosporangiaceae bacterium]